MHELRARAFKSSIETEKGPKEIVRGVDFEAKSDEIHVFMGPNGSGKSTFACSLMGHPDYLTKGRLELDGVCLDCLAPEERAKEGLFLGMQYPAEIPGVPYAGFLRTALEETKGRAPSLREWPKFLEAKAEEAGMDPKFIFRNVNEGFSGGEKKMAETFQLSVLEPKFAVLDEIDSGLDVDALRKVGTQICRSHEKGCGIILITHYARILQYVRPDFVHLFHNGKIALSGGADLAGRVEEEGYVRLLEEGNA